MKKAILIALLGFGMTTGTYAGDKKTDTNIEKIATLDVSKKQVIDMLGEPNHINVVKGKSRWVFKDDTRMINMEWDDETSSLKRFSYESRDSKTQDWDAGFTSTLKIEETTVQSVVSKLGTPQNLTVSENNQRIIYRYDDRLLRLLFREGVLEKYELTKT